MSADEEAPDDADIADEFDDLVDEKGLFIFVFAALFFCALH